MSEIKNLKKAGRPPKVTTQAVKDEYDYKKAYEQQRATISELEKKLKYLMDAVESKNTAAPSYEPRPNSLDQEIKIIHLVERAPGLTTHIKLSNIAIDFVAFGEERTLDRRQAEELAGSYRKLFEKGIIAFGAGYEDLARRFALKTVSEYEFYGNKDFLKHLGSLSLMDLEEFYNKLCDGHRAFIIEYFKRKIVDKDPAFMDMGKLEMLNRVSNGAMEGALLDLKYNK